MMGFLRRWMAELIVSPYWDWKFRSLGVSAGWLVMNAKCSNTQSSCNHRKYNNCSFGFLKHVEMPFSRTSKEVSSRFLLHCTGPSTANLPPKAWGWGCLTCILPKFFSQPCKGTVKKYCGKNSCGSLHPDRCYSSSTKIPDLPVSW